MAGAVGIGESDVRRRPKIIEALSQKKSLHTRTYIRVCRERTRPPQHFRSTKVSQTTSTSRFVDMRTCSLSSSFLPLPFCCSFVDCGWAGEKKTRVQFPFFSERKTSSPDKPIGRSLWSRRRMRGVSISLSSSSEPESSAIFLTACHRSPPQPNPGQCSNFRHINKKNREKKAEKC